LTQGQPTNFPKEGPLSADMLRGVFRSLSVARPRFLQAIAPRACTRSWLASRSALTVGAVVVTAALAPAPAFCQPAASAREADSLMNVLKAEYITECGVGAFAGYAAGFAIKRAAQVVIFTTGCLFIGMQVMANHGYVTVHWDKIEHDWKGQLDTNGDGSVTHEDMHSQYEQLVKVLESGVPGAAGFSAGFLLGLRS
jgi:uncharacterized membrane protein (Fun14 family)